MNHLQTLQAIARTEADPQRAEALLWAVAMLTPEEQDDMRKHAADMQVLRHLRNGRVLRCSTPPRPRFFWDGQDNPRANTAACRRLMKAGHIAERDDGTWTEQR